MPAVISLLIGHSRELIRAGLQSMLEQSAIQVVGSTGDVSSTLTFAIQHKPDVVVLDVMLPGGDAFDLAVKLSTVTPDTRTVFFTALDNPTYLARAHAIGAVDA